MNDPSNGAIEPQAAAPAPLSPTRPMYWSIRRELWENRSIYIAPLIVAAFVLFGSSFSNIGLAKRMSTESTSIATPHNMAPYPIWVATFLVGFFYSLDALYGERRDRSILFWKSLPVSDRTTILSKASIPLLVLPLIGVVLSVVVQLVLLLGSTAVLLANGMSPARLWSEVHFFAGLVIMPYHLFAHVLFLAPVWGWLMLVSAWARRMPVLWAILPPFTVAAVERITLKTAHFASMLEDRLMGAMTAAFEGKAAQDGHIERLSQLDPVRLLTAPGLWLGLGFAAACLAISVRLRRNREPI